MIINSEEYERLKKEIVSMEEYLLLKRERVKSYEAWQRDSNLRLGDKLYPSKAFIRHLLDHVENARPHMIARDVGSRFLRAVGFDGLGTPEVRVEIAREDELASFLFIPLDLARLMRQDWLLIREDWRGD